MLPSGLLVVHDTSGSGEDDVAELARGEKMGGVLLELGDSDVEAGRDNGGLQRCVS